MDETNLTGEPYRRVDGEPNTLLNVLVGGVVTLVTSPLLPFAAIVGGAATGYLQRGNPTAGAKSARSPAPSRLFPSS